jgi:hypothetical protein
MAKKRFYIDTSVWGNVYNRQFKVDTVLFFDMVKKYGVVCLYSEVTESELADAPEQVRLYFEDIPEWQKEKVAITPEIRVLAETYIKEGVVSETSMDDCVHIAAATVHKADALVSWNFKHIVNIDRIKGYNDINIKLGYSTLEIRSPKEVLEDGFF